MTSTDVSGLTQPGAASALPDGAVPDPVPAGQRGTPCMLHATATELAPLCPMMGQPDFAPFVIGDVPQDWLVEAKAPKLNGPCVRSHGALHEECGIDIAKRQVSVRDPVWLRIGASLSPRGGIAFDWQTGSAPEGGQRPRHGVAPSRGRG